MSGLSEERKRKLGATDLAALFRLNPWSTQLDVWERIVNGKESESTPAMERGKRMEPVLRALYASETGAQVEPRDYEQSWVIHSDSYGFACCSPDDFAVSGDGRLVTVDYKSANIWTAKKWGYPPDGLPDQYLIQLAWQMAIGSKDHAELFVGFGVDESDGSFTLKSTRLYKVERDLELESKMLERAAWWWATYVETQTPPEYEPDHPANKKRKKKK